MGAYGWESSSCDEEILTRLFELNQQKEPKGS